MMTYSESTIATFAGVFGVLLGGGLSVARDYLLRFSEARSLRAALRAEIAALIEVVEMRGLRRHLTTVENLIVDMISRGQGDTLMSFPQFPANNNYFLVFDQLIPKIGLLKPREAAAMLRFYAAARSASEMVVKRQGVDFRPSPASQMIVHIRTEAHMMDVALALGHAILKRQHTITV